MADLFTPYETGLARLLERLGKDHRRYTDALTFEQRLRENIARARRYGDDAGRSAGRAEVLDRLNALALETLGISFSELCGLIGTRPAAPPSPPEKPAPPPTAAAPAPLPACPFVAGPMIRDPRLFVGRKAELTTLVHRIEGAQPTAAHQLPGGRRHPCADPPAGGGIPRHLRAGDGGGHRAPDPLPALPGATGVLRSGGAAER